MGLLLKFIGFVTRIIAILTCIKLLVDATSSLCTEWNDTIAITAGSLSVNVILYGRLLYSDIATLRKQHSATWTDIFVTVHATLCLWVMMMTFWTTEYHSTTLDLAMLGSLALFLFGFTAQYIFFGERETWTRPPAQDCEKTPLLSSDDQERTIWESDEESVFVPELQ